MTKHYELVLLVHPDGDQPGAPLISSISSAVSATGGVMTRTEDVGRRTLAYEIRNMRKASYHVLNFSLPPGTDSAPLLKKIEELIEFDDTALRHLIVRTEDTPKGASPLKNAKSQIDDAEEERVVAKEAKPEQSDEEAPQAAEEVGESDPGVKHSGVEQ